MPEPAFRLARPTAEGLLLSALAGVATLAFARATGQGLALALLPLALAAPFVALTLPAGAQRVLRLTSRGLLAAVAGVGFVLTLYPIASEAALYRGATLAGLALAALAPVFVACRTLPAGAGAIPCPLGVITAACLWPEAPVRGLAAAAWLAAVGWLLAAGGERRLRVSATALLVLLAGGIAYGIVRLLPWAQPQVEQAVAQAMSAGESSGLSLGPRLGDIQHLSLSRRPAVRVWTPTPQYLRAKVFTRFDGREWKATPDGDRPLVPAADPDPEWDRWIGEVPGETRTPPGVAARGGVPTRMVTLVPTPGLLLAPAGTFAVRTSATPLLGNDGTVRVQVAPAGFGTVNAPAVEAAPSDPVLLELPASLDPRVRDLAAGIAPPDASPAVKIERLQAFFLSGYRYALHVGPFRTGDPVGEFLLEQKKGYCEYFASATVLILRLQGIPARYVTGFSVRASNREAGHYLVRESDAHSWAEAYVPGQGWVEVDTVPPADFEAVHAGHRDGWLGELWQGVSAQWDRIAAIVSDGGVGAVLHALAQAALQALLDHPVIVGLAALALAAPWLRRLRRPRRRAAPAPAPVDQAPPELVALLREVERWCAEEGHPRPPARAPREHVLGLPAGVLPGARRTTGLEVIEAYYAAAFGARPPSPDDLRALTARVRERAAPRA